MALTRYTKKALYVEINKELARLGFESITVRQFDNFYQDRVMKALLRPYFDYFTESKTNTLYFRKKAKDKILDKIKAKHLKTVKE